jgi:hypothetical protein
VAQQYVDMVVDLPPLAPVAPHQHLEAIDDHVVKLHNNARVVKGISRY